jgi:hypothetical protein
MKRKTRLYFTNEIQHKLHACKCEQHAQIAL